MRCSPALALALVGCIPIPAALPPANATIGLGAAVGNPLPSPIDGTPLADAAPVVVGRVEVTPLAMWPELHRRPIGVGAGYLFHVFTDELRHNRNRHGAFLAVSALAGDFWLGGNWRGRVVLRASADYLVLQDYPGDGGGASFAIGFEAADYVQLVSDAARPPLLGIAAGELGVGAELFGSAHAIDGVVYGTVGLAITGRWPGVLGVALIPLSGSL